MVGQKIRENGLAAICEQLTPKSRKIDPLFLHTHNLVKREKLKTEKRGLLFLQQFYVPEHFVIKNTRKKAYKGNFMFPKGLVPLHALNVSLVKNSISSETLNSSPKC